MLSLERAFVLCFVKIKSLKELLQGSDPTRQRGRTTAHCYCRGIQTVSATSMFGWSVLDLSRLIFSHIILFILSAEHYSSYQPNSLNCSSFRVRVEHLHQSRRRLTSLGIGVLGMHGGRYCPADLFTDCGMISTVSRKNHVHVYLAGCVKSLVLPSYFVVK